MVLDLGSIAIGVPIGIVLGVLLDRLVLIPLVIWHARMARRARRE